MKILCPFCLRYFDNSKAKFLCHNATYRCQVGATQEYVDYCNSMNPSSPVSMDSPGVQRPTVYKGGWSLFGPPKPTTCPSCGDTAADYVCPHCHNSLPADLVKYGADVIPVIGGPCSGKTNYTVALISQLENEGWRLNLTATFQDLYGSNVIEGADPLSGYKSMRERLFEDKQCLDQTRPHQHGVITPPWFVKIDTNGKKNKRPTFLIFYDIAGEHFKDASGMRTQARQLRYAAGAIVIFDARGLKNIQQVRKRRGVEERQAVYSIEETVKQLLQATDNDNVLSDAPIAFTFSKADLIEQYRLDLSPEDEIGGTVDLKQNSLFLQSCYNYRNLVRQSDFQLFLQECDSIDRGFKDGMARLGMNSVIAKKKQWKEENIHYFAVSALGQEPNDTQTIEAEEIVPYRVLDPLVWILHRLGKLDIPK